MYKGLSKMVIIQSGRYGAVVTLSVNKSRGREFDPPLLHYKTDKTRTSTQHDGNDRYKRRP
jgi:hypothetical protein